MRSVRQGGHEMKNASWLCEYARGQLGKPYWYGAFGQVASAGLLAEKRKQYPKYYDQSQYRLRFDTQFGQKVHDCSGLIKGALWCDTIDAAPKYNAAHDKGANSMIDACTEKGTINTIQNIPGLVVWKNNHIGIYIGDGEVIEARGHDYGVIKTKLEDMGWSKWGKLPWIEYSTSTKITADQALAAIKKVVNEYYEQK